MSLSQVCRLNAAVRGCGLIVLYTFGFKKFPMFLKIAKKLRPSSKVGPVPPSLYAGCVCVGGGGGMEGGMVGTGPIALFGEICMLDIGK